MSTTVDTIIRPKDLDSAGDLSAVLATTFVMVDSAGYTSLPRQVTVAALFTAAVGANYARTLNVDAALSATLQAMEIGGVATPIRVATTKVQVGDTGHLVGFLGATPAARQAVKTGINPGPNVNGATVPATYTSDAQAILQYIVNALQNFGLADAIS